MTNEAMADCAEAMEYAAEVLKRHGLESLDVRAHAEDGETLLFFTAQDGDGMHSFNTTRESR